MPRVREIEIDEVSEETRAVYQRYATEYGPFLNQVKVFAQRPPALRHIMGLVLELADEAVLPKRYLEIVLVTVSKLNECSYCVAHHVPRMVEQGLPPESAENILAETVPGFDAVDLLVRDFAVQVTEQPGRMRDAMFTSLAEHFSEEQIVELAATIAMENYRARMNRVFLIESEGLYQPDRRS